MRVNKKEMFRLKAENELVYCYILRKKEGLCSSKARRT